MLLVPGWTGFNIKTRDHIVIVESVISYLDTIDAAATDLRTAYEVLSRGCEIKDKLQLKAVVCVLVREAEVILLTFSRGKSILLLNCSLDVQ